MLPKKFAKKSVKVCNKRKRPQIKLKSIPKYAMPLEEYEAAFVMLNSNHTCFDQTPAARRLPPSKGEVNKQRYTATATGFAVHKCSRRIEFAEGYLEEIKHIDNYKMNAPSRILCEIYWCQQREDWKHMAELILAAIHKLSMSTYLVLLIDFGLMAVLHDPIAKVMLHEFLSGVVNCKNNDEKIAFLKSLKTQKKSIDMAVENVDLETCSDDGRDDDDDADECNAEDGCKGEDDEEFSDLETFSYSSTSTIY